MVWNYLDRPGVAELFEIGTGVASLVSVVVPEGATVHGQLVRDIEIPKECLIGAVIRGADYVAARGDTPIKSGDYVVS